MTFSDLLKVMIIQRWYNIQPYLQWPTNRKSYYGLSSGAVFNNLERPLPPVSRSRHFLWRWISQKRYDMPHNVIEIL